MRALFYLFAIIYGLSFWNVPTYDPDLGWHLLGGAQILATRSVPLTDPINTFLAEWIDYHWLAQIVMYKTYSIFGYDGIRITFGILMAVLSFLLAFLISKTLADKWNASIALIAFLVSVTLVGITTTFRPQIFVLIILLLVQLILKNDRFRKTEFVILFLFSVLAVNIHVYWIFIPFLWFCHRVIPNIISASNHRSSVYVWGSFFALTAAGFISPYGIFNSKLSMYSFWGNYIVIYDYLVMSSSFRHLITELKSGLAQGWISPFLLLLSLFVFARTYSVKALIKISSISTQAIITFFLAVRSVKFCSIFGVLGAPLLANSISILLNDSFTQRSFHGKYSKSVMVLALIWAIGLAAKNFPFHDNVKITHAQVLPIDACKEIQNLELQTKDGRDHIRVLTPFDFGGWCRWVAYEQAPEFDMKVTTDGRTQLVPYKHYKETFDLYDLRGEWAETLVRWSPDVILAHKSSALAQFMVRAKSDWELVYQDPIFALFLPIEN